MINEILLRVQTFLDSANREQKEVSEEVLDEFANACREAFRRQFTEGPRKNFTIRMSNIGKPLCQLQQEASGVPQEAPGYNHKMKMLIGDLVEAAAIAIMKSAGVDVNAQHQKVSLTVPVNEKGLSDTVNRCIITSGNKQYCVDIEGTLDVVIGNRVVYDIKSASSYAFSHKFQNYEAMKESDGFGYIAQGFGYATALDQQYKDKVNPAVFGGWIAVNKETGEWAVLETPKDEAYGWERQEALKLIYHNVNALIHKQEFKRCFEDVEELFYKKPTGNRILPFQCTWCDFKKQCWPNAVVLPQRASKGQNPRLMWYTEINDGQ